MVVAIDGPAGAGKSTVAKFVAQNLHFTYLNSGNIYRAVTWLALRKGIGSSADEIVAMASQSAFQLNGDNVQVDGEDISGNLRTDSVEANVAQISSIPELRTVVNALLIRLSKMGNVVVEGRDMTTIVFPNAEVKIFLDATIDSRANRRFNQKTSGLVMEDVKKNIEKRDKIDQSKLVGGLRKAPDAYYLDTTSLTIDQVCAKVVRYIQGH